MRKKPEYLARVSDAGPPGTDVRRDPEWRRYLAEAAYADLDALAAAALGEGVPMLALFDWLRGRPWAGAPSAATTSA